MSVSRRCFWTVIAAISLASCATTPTASNDATSLEYLNQTIRLLRFDTDASEREALKRLNAMVAQNSAASPFSASFNPALKEYQFRFDTSTTKNCYSQEQFERLAYTEPSIDSVSFSYARFSGGAGISMVANCVRGISVKNSSYENGGYARTETFPVTGAYISEETLNQLIRERTNDVAALRNLLTSKNSGKGVARIERAAYSTVRHRPTRGRIQFEKIPCYPVERAENTYLTSFATGVKPPRPTYSIYPHVEDAKCLGMIRL